MTIQQVPPAKAAGQAVRAGQAERVGHPAPDGRHCVVVHGGHYDGLQGGEFSAGISAQSSGATRLCLHQLHIPANSRGQCHMHADHESAVLMVAGFVEVWYGEDFAHHLVLEAGDYFFIPPNMPHIPVNTSEIDAIAIIARTDPREQEGVHLLDIPEHLAKRIERYPIIAHK